VETENSNMVILKSVTDLQNYVAAQKAKSHRIGFIPTMGALHNGHISLVQKARADGALSLCSIFLNPTQFNDKKDYDKYPVTVEDDIELLLQAGCDVLFLPPVNEIYPAGESAMATYDFGYLDTILEGARRPGHFKGVGQVVARLLDIVKPTSLYLGQKDYQQCMVISKLANILGITDLNTVVCPTVREADGLAMSSRNRRLTEPQRAIAGVIYQCLVSIESKHGATCFAIVRKECEDLLKSKGFEPEYVALADAKTLERSMVALIAAKIGDIRLIDNIVLSNRI
jgi:pantoate--beta-alanine ligase